ncbi:MAG: M50 family metallopeptidase, partial [Deltaproteobacteria bacterium]
SILIALGLCAVTLYALKDGLRDPRHNLTIIGFDQQSIVMAVIAVGAAAWFWGPNFGLALVLSVAVHEFGHVAAYRICGHSDARFRLIPLMGGVAISSSAPASQEKQFFISLMGPGICVAPVVLSLMLVPAVYPTSPMIGEFLWAFGSLGDALNFFNLLPLWPLDGGRMTHILAWVFWKGGARNITIAMSALLAAYAVYARSVIMFFFALMGAQSLAQGETLTRIQRPMSKPRALLFFAAYLAVAATHFMAGLSFITYMVIR